MVRRRVELLKFMHADITINESKKKEDIPEYDKYVSEGIEMVCGGQPDELFERDFDFVVKNPGINYHAPFILRLKERGIPVYTEIELGYKVAKKRALYCGNRNKWKNDNSDFDL